MIRKCICGLLFACIMIVSLAGCSSGEEATGQAVTSSQTEPIVTESPLTDEELVEKVILSKALQGWGVMSSPFPESAEGVAALMENCEEFSILLSRESGLQSLKTYGPVYVEKYRNDEQSKIRLNAIFMEMLLQYMFPGQETEIPIT